MLQSTELLVTLIFKEVSVADINRITIEKDQLFTLRVDNFQKELRWFSEPDQVLDIIKLDDPDYKNIVRIKSLVAGKSLINLTYIDPVTQVQRVLKTLTIIVKEPEARGANVFFGNKRLRRNS